jgi:hypothetical protein
MAPPSARFSFKIYFRAPFSCSSIIMPDDNRNKTRFVYIGKRNKLVISGGHAHRVPTPQLSLALSAAEAGRNHLNE